MSLLSKTIVSILLKTDEHQSLVKKVDDLENKVELLEKHTEALDKISRSLMETCIQLTKTITDNSKTLDLLVGFVEDMAEAEESMLDNSGKSSEKKVSEMTPEELLAHKKQMN